MDAPCFTDACALGPAEMRQAAELVYQCFAQFYDLFSANRPALLDSIAAQLVEPDSEIGHAKVLWSGGAICGAYAWYPAAEMHERQKASLRMLVDVADLKDDAFPRLRHYREQVAAVPGDAMYLARITVAPGCRGIGLGRRLLADFEAQAMQHALPAACLQVRADNRPAIGFYRAAGYVLASPPALAYHTLRKPLDAGEQGGKARAHAG